MRLKEKEMIKIFPKSSSFFFCFYLLDRCLFVHVLIFPNPKCGTVVKADDVVG